MAFPNETNLFDMDETRPDGSIEQVLILDDVARETRLCVKNTFGAYHDLLTGRSSTDVLGAGAVGDGATDDVVAIQALIDSISAAGGGIVYFPSATYALSNTLVGKENVFLVLDIDAILYPTTNSNVLEVQKNCRVSGGVIDGSGVVGFTAAGIYLVGNHQLHGFNVDGHITHVSNMRIHDLDNGKAIYLYAPTSDGGFGNASWVNVAFTRFSNIHIGTCEFGIVLEGEIPSAASTQNRSVPGNIFESITMFNVDNMIVLDANDWPISAGSKSVNIGGNMFSDIQIQAWTTGIVALDLQGNANWFDIYLWDWNRTGQNTEDAFQIKLGSSNNVIKHNLNGSYHVDNGFSNRFESPVDQASPYGQRYGGYLPSPSNKAFYGNQDDFFFLADERFIITNANAPTTGTLANVFNFNQIDTAVWNAAAMAAPVVIEIDLSIVYSFWTAVGVNFRGGQNVPAEVKLEQWRGGAWEVVGERLDIQNSGQAHQIVIAWRPDGVTNSQVISKVRLTFTGLARAGANPASTAMTIERIWGCLSSTVGYAYLPRNGGRLHGALIQKEVQTFVVDDASPPVGGGNTFETANANPTTITMFDGGADGQVIRVIFQDTNTTVDFTGTNLKGNAGVDWSPIVGDHLTAVFDGTNWYCDISDNTA